MKQVAFRSFITHSGKLFNFSDLNEDLICLEDIAHHLTKTCRYGGALPLNIHYSVAQHSIHLCDYVYNLWPQYRYEMARLALFHDATEAYMGDVVSGVKQFLPDYYKIEAKLQNTIFNKYKIVYNETLMYDMKTLDTCIVLDEARKFLPQAYHVFKNQLRGISPLNIDIDILDSRIVKGMFLERCKLLGIG